MAVGAESTAQKTTGFENCSKSTGSCGSETDLDRFGDSTIFDVSFFLAPSFLISAPENVSVEPRDTSDILKTALPRSLEENHEKGKIKKENAVAELWLVLPVG